VPDVYCIGYTNLLSSRSTQGHLRGDGCDLQANLDTMRVNFQAPCEHRRGEKHQTLQFFLLHSVVHATIPTNGLNSQSTYITHRDMPMQEYGSRVSPPPSGVFLPCCQ